MRKFFNYSLSGSLIAQYPLKEREKARLMVVRRENGGIEEGLFSDLEGYFQKGDVLVLNDTRVIPARLNGVKDTGGRVEIFLLRKVEPFRWEALLRGRIREGQICRLDNGKTTSGVPDNLARILSRTQKGSYMVEFSTDKDEEIFRFGKTPLPPYIKRSPTKEDESYYQTVYAAKKGAVAAPTAGLHFTNEMLERIKKKGINVVYITLHIGWASFKILEENGNTAGEEYREISEESASIINATRESGKKVFAVGTSVVRTLESSVRNGRVVPSVGYTDLFIKPEFSFRTVDALITNFHLPGSTHLYLVCAFAGVDLMEKAYRIAVENRYRFYSYGDAMLII